MFAVILTGGKQYTVKEGDVLNIEKIGVESGRPFEFSRVLLIADGSKVMVGTPFLSNSGVRAEVLEHHLGDKVFIFKKKRRKQYRRFKGHRQELVRVRITDIVPDLSQAPAKKAAPPVEKAAVPPPAAAQAPLPAKPAAKSTEKAKAAEKPAPPKEKKPKQAKPAAKPAKEAKAEKAKPKAAAKKPEQAKAAAKTKKAR